MNQTGKRVRYALLAVSFAIGLAWLVWLAAVGASWLLVVFTSGQDPILEIPQGLQGLFAGLLSMKTRMRESPAFEKNLRCL